jgi:hypothetical protein
LQYKQQSSISLFLHIQVNSPRLLCSQGFKHHKRQLSIRYCWLKDRVSSNRSMITIKKGTGMSSHTEWLSGVQRKQDALSTSSWSTCNACHSTEHSSEVNRTFSYAFYQHLRLPGLMHSHRDKFDVTSPYSSRDSLQSPPQPTLRLSSVHPRVYDEPSMAGFHGYAVTGSTCSGYGETTLIEPSNAAV